MNPVSGRDILLFFSVDNHVLSWGHNIVVATYMIVAPITDLLFCQIYTLWSIVTLVGFLILWYLLEKKHWTAAWAEATLFTILSFILFYYNTQT
jgi:hypothetical protein